MASFGEGAVAAGLSAHDAIRTAAPIVGGGGGGKANMARAGGKDAARLDDALRAAAAVIRDQVAGS